MHLTGARPPAAEIEIPPFPADPCFYQHGRMVALVAEFRVTPRAVRDLGRRSLLHCFPPSSIAAFLALRIPLRKDRKEILERSGIFAPVSRWSLGQFIPWRKPVALRESDNCFFRNGSINLRLGRGNRTNCNNIRCGCGCGLFCHWHFIGKGCIVSFQCVMASSLALFGSTCEYEIALTSEPLLTPLVIISEVPKSHDGLAPLVPIFRIADHSAKLDIIIRKGTITGAPGADQEAHIRAEFSRGKVVGIAYEGVCP